MLVAPDGTAAVNGKRLPPTSMPVQTAVLDELHQHAQVRNLAVEATVLDQQHKWALRLRVRPDGSSELLEEPETMHPAEPVGAAGAGQPVRRPPDPRPDVGGGVPDATPLDQDTTLRITTDRVAATPRRPESSPDAEARGGDQAVAQPQHSAPDGQPLAPLRPLAATHAPSTPSGDPIPEELAGTLVRIGEAVAAGKTALAADLATTLKQEALRRFGPEHPHTLEAYAVDAYAAHLDGRQEHSTAVSLRLARLRYAQGDPRARDEILRAANTWNLLKAPDVAVPLGEELHSLWLQLAAEAGDTAVDAHGLQHVQSRLAALTRNVGHQSQATDAPQTASG
ncbi:hypothetical protein [Streptomyces hygroscopicus]|uniref:hypothetical protein n=1 Tax=Streptomyces hygroscopicus TaxID=1912 RepID=UPI002240B8A5|nr:hypothetical protein [Streptomyces hygroscopicus]